jgi:nitric oxide dioxygenase
MTPRQINLLQSSYDKLQPMAAQAGHLFFHRLNVVDPSMRQAIDVTAEDEGTKLLQAVGLAVTVVKHLDAMSPALEEMRSQSGASGVKEQHYEALGACMLWTLEKQLQGAFTTETREAWIAAWLTLSGAMKRGRASIAPYSLVKRLR